MVAEPSTRPPAVHPIATLLLLLMAVLYGLARSFESTYPWLTWLRAFAEAGMVGALADWFAVVALFRHPMGLPIPHTAILRRKKEVIGTTLARFVVGNFLDREVITKRLENLDMAGPLCQWVDHQAAVIAARVYAHLPQLLDTLDAKNTEHTIHALLKERLTALPAAPLLGEALDTLLTGKRQETLVSACLQVAASCVAENKDYIRTSIRKDIPLPELFAGAPWLVAAREQLATFAAEKVVDRIQNSLAEAESDPDSHLRQEFVRRLARFIDDLRHDPETMATGEKLKHDLLAHPALRAFASSAWTDIKASITAAEAGPAVQTKLTEFFQSIATSILQDRQMRDGLNEKLRRIVPALVAQHRDQVHGLIEETVKSWDPEKLTSKIEAEVGPDLQFIRINGTLIGGCVGLLLHAIGRLLWG